METEREPISPPLARAIRVGFVIASVGSWTIGFVMGMIITMALT